MRRAPMLSGQSRGVCRARHLYIRRECIETRNLLLPPFIVSLVLYTPQTNVDMKKGMARKQARIKEPDPART